MVLIALCFVLEYLRCFHFVYAGNSAAAYSGIVAISACDIFSFYEGLIVNLYFPHRFLEWESLSDCGISRSLLTFTVLFIRTQTR